MQRKIKSTQYLDYLHSKRCFVCGSSQIEVHHESLIPGFLGGRKKYNDFQGTCLCNQHHTERHHIGNEIFWEKHNVDPTKHILRLLEDYMNTVHPKKFTSMEAYEEELETVQETIYILS